VCGRPSSRLAHRSWRRSRLASAHDLAHGDSVIERLPDRMRDSPQSRAGSSASRVHRPSIACSPVTGRLDFGTLMSCHLRARPPSESGALTATPGRSAHCCPDRRSRSTAGPRRDPTYKADVGRIGWLLALLLAQTTVTRVDAESHTSAPGLGRHRAAGGTQAPRRRPVWIVGVTAGRLVPQTCQIERGAKQTCGHSRLAPSFRAAPELSQCTP
jgi:hypothetical protein